MEKQEHTPGEWSYSINYGPDGEQNYANVYDAAGEFVGNLRTYHAISIVRGMNAAPAMLSALQDIQDFLKRSGYDTRLVREVIAAATGEAP